jgi:hypothetical protein
MTPITPTTSSPIRLLIWRVAALATDFALRNRAGMASLWPFIQLIGGGLIAYAVGRLFGAWALAAIP